MSAVSLGGAMSCCSGMKSWAALSLLSGSLGLPGERVEIRQGQVFINGEPLAEDYVKGERTGDFEGVDVPEDCYFLLGDNRQHSYDAREWSNPFVERKKIAAKAEFVLFPAFKRIK